MFNYIKADLYRIFHKRSNQLYWIILAGLFLAFIILGSSSADFDGSELANMYFTAGAMPTGLFGPLIICPQIYYAVYLDELNNKSFVRLFSSGLRKSEYIVAKLISTMIYMFAVFAFLALAYVVGFGILVLLNSGATFFSMNQILLLLSLVFYLSIFTIAFSSLTNLISLKLQSGNISLFLFFIISNGFIASIIGWINRLPILKNFDFDPYLLSTNIGEVGDTLMGNFFPSQQNVAGSEVVTQDVSKIIHEIGSQPIIIIGIYVIVTTVLSFFILKRSDIKEN